MELAGIVVHQSKKLFTWHGLGVHDRRHNIDTHLLIGHLKRFPDRSFAAARWADNDDAHSLLGRLVELLDLADLRVDVLKLELGNRRIDRLCERLVLDVGGVDAGEHVSLQGFVLDRVVVGQL